MESLGGVRYNERKRKRVKYETVYYASERTITVKAKVFRVKVEEGGVIQLVDPELPPGEIDLIVLLPDSKFPKCVDSKELPLGGHNSGGISPEYLRRKVIYESE